MKQLIFFISLAFTFVSCNLISSSERAKNPESGYSPPDTWSTAYLASWHHSSPALGDTIHQMPTNEINWQAFSHLSYAGLTVGSDGSLIPLKAYQNLEDIKSQIEEIVSVAHAEEVPVLLSVGGWGSRENFVETIKEGSQQKLISTLTSMLKTHDLDGIDLNIEPIEDEDTEYYKEFVSKLDSALQSIDPPIPDRPILTAATSWQAGMFSQIHSRFEQINVMTYNYSNAWEGWVTWHNAPVYSGGHTFPGDDELLPSVNEDVERFLKAGVPKEKLGIGIDFYGYVWTGGVTGPLQEWVIPPKVQADIPYHAIIDSLYETDYYNWNDEIKAAYLSIDKADSLDDKFVSFEEEKAIQAKANYIKGKGLGGAIIWELSGGYRADQPQGKRNVLQQAVEDAFQKQN